MDDDDNDVDDDEEEDEARVNVFETKPVINEFFSMDFQTVVRIEEFFQSCIFQFEMLPQKLN